MSDPSLALQGALVATLKAAATEAGNNVFDQVPGTGAGPFPRIVVGDGQSIGNRADCYDGSEVFLDINVYTQAVGYPQTKRIASEIRTVLDDADLTLVGHRLELMEFRDAVFSRDPDGKTRRARMTIRALTQSLDGSGS